MFENCVNKHIKDGKVLTRRREKPQMRLCLSDALIVARRCIAILAHQHSSAQNWTFDGFLNRLLIMSLLVAVGARTGDLGIPTGFGKDAKAETLALQICEIDLHLAHSTTLALSLENVVLTISLTCFKGNK